MYLYQQWYRQRESNKWDEFENIDGRKLSKRNYF